MKFYHILFFKLRDKREIKLREKRDKTKTFSPREKREINKEKR